MFFIRKFVKTLLYTIVHRLFSQDFSQLLDPTVHTVQCLLDGLTAISKSTEKNCDQSVATCENIYCSASLDSIVFLNRIISVKSVITHRF